MPTSSVRDEKEVEPMNPNIPPRTPRGGSITIDCQTCPVRGRHCDDCFVPVLGQIWLQEPTLRVHRSAPESAPEPDAPRADPGRSPLDDDESAAVSALVRAGLVAPEEARRAAAVVSPARSATG